MGRPAQAYEDKGELVWQVEFDIYGRIRENLFNNKQFIPFRQLGQYEYKELDGLYYNRFRYYNPETGSYISQDPIGLAGNNPNFYAYVSDSNTMVDVFGLFELFRAVFGAEYSDIVTNNVIRNVRGQYETGKLFATNYGDAVKFGKLLQQWEDTAFKVVTVEVPDDIALYKFRAEGMDAVSIDNIDLDKIKIKCT